jgi:exopolyphosphatase/guanosine-5'-triphosphate,3'-diphosphate pyrophosphatase
MAIAAIDMGSNSIRLLIGHVVEGEVVPLMYERVATRLMGGMAYKRILQEGAMQATVDALNGFLDIMKGYGVRNIKAVGTGALREAENTGSFLDLVRKETGIDVNVISGIEEASFTAMAAISTIDRHLDSLVLDIGGGSTEMVCSSSGEIIDINTTPAGVVTLFEKHIHSDPPSAADMNSLKEECRTVALMANDRFGARIEPETVLIGTAGTATTLACIDMAIDISDWVKAHMHVIPLERLRKIADSLLCVPLGERALIKGLEPDRTDLIITGITLTIMIMEEMGFTEMLVSNYGLLEGALLGLAAEVSE